MDVSIVIPAYNAAELIAATLRELSAFLDEHTEIFGEHEIILVDDGSTDETLQIVRKSFPHVVTIALTRNSGKGAAVRAGMQAARGDRRLYMDCDLPYRLEALGVVAERLRSGGIDLCIGSRDLPGSEFLVHSGKLRRVASWMFTTLVSRLVLPGIEDSQCGLKGFAAATASRLFGEARVDGFAFDVEILYLARRHGLAIERVPVRQWLASPSSLRLFRDGGGMLRDLVRIRLRGSLNAAPSSAMAPELESRALDRILDGVEGRTVLDVGCHTGALCAEAARRGAVRVLGLEIEKARVLRATETVRPWGARVEIRRHDVETGLPAESFDYVICLNVLHHMADPLALLQACADRTRDRLVLEVAGFGRHDRRKFGRWGRIRRLERFPVIWVGEGNGYLLGKGQRFFFSPEPLRTLLLQQRHLFADVELFPRAYKDRSMLVAYRRKVGHLVVVAGPTAVGKSTLIERMRAGSAPEIAAQLGLSGFEDFAVVSADALSADRQRRTEKLILHYDTALPHVEEHAWTYARDPALDLLACAERVSVVSLRASAKTLRERLVESEFGGRRPRGSRDLYQLWERLPHFLQGWSLVLTRSLRRRAFFDRRLKRLASLPRHRRLYRLYHEDTAVDTLYSGWRSFVESVETEHRLEVDAGQEAGGACGQRDAPLTGP